MRILVVSNLYPPVVAGGYEVECAGVVEHLRRRHEVHVVASKRRRQEAPRQAGIERSLPWLESDWRGVVRAVPGSMVAARAARAAARRTQPDLLYVWNGANVPHAALSVLDSIGVPVAFRVCEHWFGGLYERDQFMRYLRPGHRGAHALWGRGVRTLNRVDPALRLEVDRRVPVAVSWVSQALRSLVAPPPAVDIRHEEVLLPATASSERFVGIARAPGPEPLVVFAGRLEPQKAPDVALRAVAALERGHGITARLVLAGPDDGATAARLRALAAELGIADRVEVPGRLDSDAMTALLGRAHVYVFPPRWQEPAGLGCVEAAFARVPVVASRVGGVPEMLHHEEHALLFDNEDVAGCADALARVLSESDATAARVARAFERVQPWRLAPYLQATEGFLERSLAVLSRA